MVLGFGKDANTNTDHEPSKVEKQGIERETTDNNVDPARNAVNPQVLSSEEFIRNSLTYGLRVPTGATSTWDRRLTTPQKEFHKTLRERYDTLEASKDESVTEENKYFTTTTSINNYLMGQMNDLGEGIERVDKGRQRGRDVQEPAHHFNFHDPTIHDRVHGALNIIGGKIRMDQDISTRGRAEFKGQTDDGH